jgi:hypothetical protein
VLRLPDKPAVVGLLPLAPPTTGFLPFGGILCAWLLGLGALVEAADLELEVVTAALGATCEDLGGELVFDYVPTPPLPWLLFAVFGGESEVLSRCGGDPFAWPAVAFCDFINEIEFNYFKSI